MQARFLSFAMAALLCSGLALSKVNVNTATAEELDTLYGIGEARAQAIIEYRRQNGAFKSLRDLKKVPGLHENVVEGLKGKVSFSGPSRIDAADGAATKASDKKDSPGKIPRATDTSGPTKPMSLPTPPRNEMAPAGPARPAMPGKAAGDTKAATVVEKPASPVSPAQPAGPAKPMLDGKPAVPAPPAIASSPGGAPARPAAPAVPAAPAKPALPASSVAKPAAPVPAPAAGAEARAPAPAAPAKPAGPAKPAVPAASY